MQRKIVVIAHNIRSTHNVGSILRTCDGFGVVKVYFTGYTPCPASEKDERLPHLVEKITKQIHKTALGAEQTVKWEKGEISEVISKLKEQQFSIVALEQSSISVNLADYRPTKKIALLLGEEVAGVNQDLLNLCDQTIEIPMLGDKESFNVSVAVGIALYHTRFWN